MANNEKEQLNYFQELNDVNVNDKVEQKNGLSYLSWAYAWAEIKKRHPDAQYTIYENAEGWNYFTDGKTCWVKTGVTVNGLEHIEYLPVMDMRNKSIQLDAVTSFDVNKAIQRSLTKACARHGLGLYVYAGEDLPEAEKDTSGSEPCGQELLQQLYDLGATPEILCSMFKVASVDVITKEQATNLIAAKQQQLERLKAKNG